MDCFWAAVLALVFCGRNLVSIRIEMHRKFEVWFYTGALMGIYGVLLTVAGAYQWGILRIRG
jgi:hypothetical protein